jgi:hypothetical protein
MTDSEDHVVQIDSDQQTRKRKIHCKQELIINSLQKFYSNRTDTDEIMKLLQGTSTISLRLIDWFVTNYARQHAISYILNNQEFLVYLNYKSQLKAYSKKLFDPFCRRERIMFQIGQRESFLTTVGKLNFFRWAIEKGILDYIRNHTADIEREMNLFMKDIQNDKKSAPSTASSTASTAQSTLSTITGSVTNSLNSISSTKSSTRRRVANKEISSTKIMQKHDMIVEVRFD